MRLSAAALSVAAIAGAAHGYPATARACSCSGTTEWRNKIYPERELLAGDGAFLVVTRYLEAPVVRLVDSATGFEVPVETEGWLVVGPLGERWTLVRPATTFARQTDLEVFERLGEDCPPLFCWTHDRMTRLRLVFDPPGQDLRFFVFQLRRQGEAEPFYELPMLGDTMKLESRICEPDVPALTPDDTYCGRLVVYGRDGEAVEGTPEYCRTAALCPATPPACEAGQYCEPLDIGTGDPDAGPEARPPSVDDRGCRSAGNNDGAQLVVLLGVLLVVRLVRSAAGPHQTGGVCNVERDAREVVLRAGRLGSARGDLRLGSPDESRDT